MKLSNIKMFHSLTLTQYRGMLQLQTLPHNELLQDLPWIIKVNSLKSLHQRKKKFMIEKNS